MAEVDFVVAPAGDFLRKTYGLTIKTTDLETSSFPDYVDPFEDSNTMASHLSAPGDAHAKTLAGKLKDDPDRHPSPQPTHLGGGGGGMYLSRANGNGHRTMRSATLGYIAPEFTGKAEQMKQGKPGPFAFEGLS